MEDEAKLFVKEIKPDFSTNKYLGKTLMLINKCNKYSWPDNGYIGKVEQSSFSEGIDLILEGFSLRNHGGIVSDYKPYFKIFNSIFYGESVYEILPLTKENFPPCNKFYLFGDGINSQELIYLLDVVLKEGKTSEILLEK